MPRRAAGTQAGEVSTAPNDPLVPGQRPGQPHGATALGADAQGRPHRHSRHVVGNTLRAAKVFVGTAFDVVVLGDHEGRPVRPERPEHPDRTPPHGSGTGNTHG